MAFKKGQKKTGGIKKGDKQTKTKVRLALAERIADFDNDLYNITKNLLKNPKTKLATWQTLTKLRVPAVTKLIGDKDNPIDLNLKIEVKKYI